MSVSSSAESCPHCGAPLPPGVPASRCPRCLLAQAMEATGAGGDDVLRAPPLTPAELAPRFPQLEILELLGRGGMGVVYKARQKSLNRLVALKLLAPERVTDAEFAGRFAREAQALAALNHPSIVTIHEFGCADGLYFLIMEFVDGVNLRQAMKAGRFTPEQALAVVPPVCEALQYAHEHGIVHRDIKPENLLLDKGGRVKIADFGIAKMLGDETAAGPADSQTAGTPQYMAPEQRAHQRADHRADIYSLGVVLYEMLTGELPGAKLQPPSRKVQVDVRLDEIVLRALEKSPELRYQTAAELRTEVETVAPRSAPPPAPAPARSRARPWIIAALVVLGLFVLGLAIPLLVYALSKAPEPQTARAELLSRQGWQLWQAGKPVAALPIFREASKLAPADPQVWNGLGWSALNSGLNDEAEKAFEKCRALDPSHPGALNGLGQLHLIRREYDRAEAPLLQAAERGATAAWWGLARLYMIQGRFEEAKKWAQMVADSGQGDAVTKRMLEDAAAGRLTDGLRMTIEPPLLVPPAASPKPSN